MSSALPKAEAKKRAPRDDAASLPTAEELRASAEALAALAASPRHSRAFSFLRSLAASPPRAILLEGGGAHERAGTALYWGMALNCENSSRGGDFSGPCLSCPVCLKFLARMHRDLFFLDGAAGGISIDEVRQLRGVLGEAAREANYRVVILSEAQALSEAAANAMLKSLEEAPPATVFALTAPQRERLLPTLVSRSWVLTLSWPDPLVAGDGPAGDAERDWTPTAAAFLETGKGLFEKTGARGGVDAASANALLGVCRRALAQAHSGMTGGDVPPGASAGVDLARFFAALPEPRLAVAHAVLAEGEESLVAQVNPALVADWVMTRLFLLGPQNRR
ncbi:MAG: DNA polymerase III subunit delta' [Deltaproteobacteria bacterium]|jgi:DNA polymerase-3 subunit delta'|nr:DNA polymerase III subunit delta' [Deltaproteobacteria bacterium]